MRGPDFPGMPFNQQMGLPSELILHLTKYGHRLHRNPVKEFEKLRIKIYRWINILVDKTCNILSDLNNDLYEIEIEFLPGEKNNLYRWVS